MQPKYKMVALVDCNNFYVSCERLFNPLLERRPVVVLSNNDGCVISRSNEAKTLGIGMGAPVFMMEDLLRREQVAVCSSNYTLYGSMSARVMNTLQTYVSRMEIYSIDEAFLDLGGLSSSALAGLAETIRNTISNDVGIPVTIGIGPTKTLAKMANRHAKINKECASIFIADNRGDINLLLSATPVDYIWGIGSSYARLLKQHKIFTAVDLLNIPTGWIKKNMTVKELRTFHELQGISCISWDDISLPKKAICIARSFGKLLSEKKDIREALVHYTSDCALKLRQQQSCATMLQVFIQTNTHRTTDKQYCRSICMPLSPASNDAMYLIKAATAAFDRIFKEGYQYKKVGILVSALVPQSTVQQAIFDNKNKYTESHRMMAFDKINQLFGKGTVRFASQGYENKWKLRQENLSPCYTTDITQVINILK